MKQFAEEPKEIKILDENGEVLLAKDNEHHFFEASWMHKYNGKYYSPILPAIHISSVMPLETILMAHLPIKEESSNP